MQTDSWRVILLTGILGVALAGCDEHRNIGLTGPSASDGIVVESVKLDRDVFVGCEVHGTLRNDSASGHRVTLVLKAFNRAGSVIATALANVGFVGTGQRATYRAVFHDFHDDILFDCDRIARVALGDVLIS